MSRSLQILRPKLVGRRWLSTTLPRCNSEAQAIEEEFQSTARKFCRDEIVPNAPKFDQTGEYPWDIVKKAHSLGLMNTDTPEEYGGLNLTLAAKTKIYEEIAYGDTAIGTSLMVNELAQIPILYAGSDYLKEKYMGWNVKEPILAAYCTTEADAGSDVANAKTKAVKDGDDYILDGTKVWISNCGLAKWYFVLAKTDAGASPSKAFTGFIVDRDLPGVSVGKKEKNMGQRCSDTRSLTLEGVRVPSKNIVGKVGQGFLLAMRAFDRTRPIVASMGCGVQQRCIDEAGQYAVTRKCFGKPIADHQGTGFKLADMAVNLEASRLLVEKAARKVDSQADDATYYSSIAKVFSTDNAFKAACEAVQIFGGNGFNTEYPVEKLLRDSKILQIYGGTSEIQRLVVSRKVASLYK
ncbi:unnamed protein product [Bursaphelenchus okinawaensis]|uniref:Uncharacterized protein n=1 Tax=Bursaphelenchus okinawaensis TaxID=465554 RepID=A0A811LPT0_9BILA|nr:unnamed protein product [Bursaphelenchus okinawaensis]CAG9127162.1 unnamed protein product [Bursaphelenchus okinawaensis]